MPSMAPHDMITASLENNNSTRVNQAATVEQGVKAGDAVSPTLPDHIGIQRLAIDDQQTAAPSHTHAPKIELPRENFPLPRELRDHIYSYLLDAKHARIIRANAGDRAYNFHTEILSVNRQIHSEAEEYLYKHHEFIVVNSQLSSEDTPFLLFVPFVAELHPSVFAHHLLEVHLSDSERPKSQTSSWLLLSKDAELCGLVVSRILATRRDPPPQLIFLEDGQLLDTLAVNQGQQQGFGRLRLEFRSQVPCKASADQQASLLATSCTMDGPTLAVSICGDVLDRTSAQALEVSLGPGLQCMSAVHWHCLMVLDGLKAAADASVRENELAPAEFLYEQVVETIESWKCSPSWQASDCRRPLLYLLMNTQLTKAYFHMKTQDRSGFIRTVFEILDLTGGSHRAGPLGSCVFHPHMLAVTMIASWSTVVPAFPSTSITECIAHLSSLNYAQQRHGIAILKRCTDQNKPFEPTDLPAAFCSFYAMRDPMLCFGKRLTNPDHIFGGLDLVQLRKIDKETRGSINKVEADRGWRITPFEDYDLADN